jgi:exosortase
MADPQYSHGFLVPVVSGWLAWRWIRRVGAPDEGQLVLGPAEILAGCCLHWSSAIVFCPQLDFVALALCLRGLALAVGGSEWARGFNFPIGFLFFMFPLPFHLTAAAAVWLQEAVARVSAPLLDLFVVCYQRGSCLYLAGVDQPLVVAPECSGLRQIEAFVAIATLLGYLSQRSLVKRILFVLAAVPVAVAANVVRVLLMAFGVRCFGSGWLGGFLHDVPAMFTVPLGLGLLVLTGWVLGNYHDGAAPEDGS